MDLSTIEKLTPIISMPGVFDVDFRPEANQVWISVYGAPESINAATLIAESFQTEVNDHSHYIPEFSEKISDYNFYIDELIIEVSGWLPEKEKAPAVTQEPQENTSPDSTTKWTPEQILRNEG